MRPVRNILALGHFRRDGLVAACLGSQTDTGDYAALLGRLKGMTGWDDSARWPAGALPDIGPFDRRVNHFTLRSPRLRYDVAR